MKIIFKTYIKPFKIKLKTFQVFKYIYFYKILKINFKK